MSKLGIIKGLDDGFFQEARQSKIGPLDWLSRKVISELGAAGADADGKDLDVQADLDRHVGRTLKRLGQPDDGSLQAKRVRHAALQTYGLEKELAARAIYPETDYASKFLSPGVTENSPLFPPFLATTFIMARLSAGLVDQLVFADTMIDRLQINKVRLNEAADARQMRNVAIGADLPETELSRVETTVPIRKYGRMFTYAREVLEMQPLAVVAGFIGQLARQVAVDETDECLNILHAGDGETGSAVTDTTPATDGSLVYSDLIKLEDAFNNSYAGRTYVATQAEFRTILGMAEYKDPLANRGLQFERGIPNVPTPSGIGRIWRWQSTNTTYMAESGGRIAAADPSAACYVARTSMLEEQDTIIKSGRIQVALSYHMAVVKGDPDAFESLDITA